MIVPSHMYIGIPGPDASIPAVPAAPVPTTSIPTDSEGPTEGPEEGDENDHVRRFFPENWLWVLRQTK